MCCRLPFLFWVSIICLCFIVFCFVGLKALLWSRNFCLVCLSESGVFSSLCCYQPPSNAVRFSFSSSWENKGNILLTLKVYFHTVEFIDLTTSNLSAYICLYKKKKQNCCCGMSSCQPREEKERERERERGG